MAGILGSLALFQPSPVSESLSRDSRSPLNWKLPFVFLALVTGAIAAPPAEIPITAGRLLELQKAAPLDALEKPSEGDPAPVSSKDQSILRQSVILHDGTHWTLVPAGAVIHQPAGLRSLVGAKAVGQLLTWPDFLAKNLSWISTTEVTFDEAAGTSALPQERIAIWAKHDKVIVAVHHGGPISVRLPGDNQVLTQR